MPRYSTAFKAKVVQRMLGPDQRSASSLAKETGVSQVTLSRWKSEARTIGGMSKKSKKQNKRTKRWTPAERLRVLAESEKLSDEDLGEFLRREGLHSTDLERWREQALSALTDTRNKSTSEQKELKKIRRELRRKEKALAEAAALLVLQEKVQEIWGGGDDDTNEGSDK